MPSRDKLTAKTDVLVIYQDRYQVGKTIEKVQNLHLSFQCIRMSKDNHEKIIACQAKIILLSSHHMITGTEFYLDLLVQCKEQLANHHAIALIHLDEASEAFSACEDGLFDSYIIIEPSFEEERLSLVLMQSLKAIAEHKLYTSKLLSNDNHEQTTTGDVQKKLLLNSLNLQLKNYQRSLENRLKQLISDAQQQSSIHQAIHDCTQQLLSDIDTKMGQQLIDISKDIQIATLKNITNNKRLNSRINYADKPLPKKANDVISFKHQANVCYKILIAESSMLLANAIAEIFENMNFKIRISINGRQTLQAFDDFSPDLILLEDNLAQMDGIAVTRKIRNGGSCIPIIVLAERKNKSQLKHWLPLGISEYLAKSTNHKVILDTVINELLNPSGLLKFKTENNIDQIQWLPEYSVGHPLMDEHHQQLFQIIKEFINSEHNIEQTITIFQKLNKYMLMHFAEEEKLMLANNFPNLIEHKAEHYSIVKKVKAMQEKLLQKDEETHNKIGLFLYKWLSHHILKSDMEYKWFVSTEQKNTALLGDF
ncbi:bacteriohemerythrin [Thalassotalea sp. PLHSN55]|uniref:bacteriohemerythrin n=1 Tax=Thalassotalea sp. PLHSN55 TaxID=3435888 RepID=UPI003F8716C8